MQAHSRLGSIQAKRRQNTSFLGQGMSLQTLKSLLYERSLGCLENPLL
ncbi:hypothetical protein MM0357_03100 [Helicobacter pylori]